MRTKDTIIVALLLIAALLGYRVSVYRAEKRKEIEFRLVVDKAMYEASLRGDLQKVRRSSSILLLSDVRDYERRFGTPSGTDRFARDFAAAQLMAQSIEGQLVPIGSIATNLGSNVTIDLDQER